MDFKTLLARPDFLFLDGAMGTMLQQKGMPLGVVPETMNLLHPEWLLDIHRRYLEAGAQILYANTFGASPYKAQGCGHEPEELVRAGVSLAREAAGDRALVALDMGPLGQLLEPTGTLTFDEAYEAFARQVRAGAEAGADLAVIETMTDLYEMKAALLAVKENSDLPVICTMTFEGNGRTFTGCGIPSMALTLEGLGADAIGINCSLGPREMLPLARELLRWTTLPLVMKPNAGLPDPATGRYDISPEEFGAAMAELARAGVQVLGGCCGTDPRYIAAIRETVAGIPFSRPETVIPPAVCSPSRVVTTGGVRVIGERINPTGKKRFKEALRNRELDYILAQGLDQAAAGADILDVNVGLPEIDEKAAMVKVVKALQGVTELPLQLDSSSPEVLEAALRAYNGKAIVNSVNGNRETLDRVLPLVKKYGAAVVGLTLDHRGILTSAQDRVEIAKTILKAALAHGIRREDVYIDCLTLTVSAQQESALETLRAVKMVREELGCPTVLGVSNISFGLPARELINPAFLTLALGAGLNLPILNPNAGAMMGAVRAWAVLSGTDRDSRDFVAWYGQTGGAHAASPAPVTTIRELDYAVEHGLKNDAAALARELLETTDPMEIVNQKLIPPLDRAGAAFEKGEIFLPQLIQCAGAAQAAFEVIRERMAGEGPREMKKGPIVLATVQGDIHDIGKNIVKILLENYGYAILDLGKDVPPQAVADAVRQSGAPLVGLSALMTTTLGSMAETIALLHREGLPCRVMVGGAVLTPEYAKKIGADWYARDAKESVDIAKGLLG
jgi:5-methyltetrahydrofolate--homocysteine methyltransferase